MMDCAPSKLLSDIHYRLPHLSHVRFGGNFTDDSLSETLPGEIVHVGGWAGILLTISLLLMACFYVLCCCLCIRCKKGKCTAYQTQNTQQLLRCMSGTLAILSVVLVLLAFWPEARMHNGISSSSDDAQELLLEIAEDVVESALLSIEQRRHSLVICYLVSLLLLMIVAVFIIFFAQRCTCGTGVFITMIVLAGVTTAVHIPLVVFLFAVLVMYADMCISIYSTGDGSLCMNIMQQNMSVNPNSLNMFCNQTVYHGFILIMVTLSLAALLILIQFFGFCYGSLLCCIKEDNNEESGIKMRDLVTGTTANDNNIVSSNWTPQKNFLGLTPIDRSSREWVQIKNRVHHTLKEANIIDIQQIHNKWLWDAYAQSRLRLSAKNGGITNVNEMLLFHGTRQTRPEQIYNSEKGFDFRFSNPGLWGEGAYFAVNAQYSDRYAYEPSGGRRQFFLAMVLTGESCTCGENRSLKKPPLKERNKMFTDERYDSVHGKTGGSDIYVVYEHDKAYPAYLITYTSLHSQQ